MAIVADQSDDVQVKMTYICVHSSQKWGFCYQKKILEKGNLPFMAIVADQSDDVQVKWRIYIRFYFWKGLFVYAYIVSPSHDEQGNKLGIEG